MREILTDVSREQARQGASPADVAMFIFSLKQIIFRSLQAEFGENPEAFAREIWSVTTVLDRLGLFTTQVAMKSREEVIARQQAEMLELSTPVVKLWEGILALPLIGTLDSERTQVVMERSSGRDRAYRRGDRDYRHYGRADGGYPGGPAPSENGGGGPPDGGRMHHQRPYGRRSLPPSCISAWIWEMYPPRPPWRMPFAIALRRSNLSIVRLAAPRKQAVE